MLWLKMNMGHVGFKDWYCVGCKILRWPLIEFMVVPLRVLSLEITSFVSQVIWYLERVKMNLCIESLPLLDLACATEGFCLSALSHLNILN